MMKQLFIKIEDTLELLIDNRNKLPYRIYKEIESICYPISHDIAYIIADLIRDNRIKSFWELKITKNNELIMLLNEAHKELKYSIFKILEQNNAIHIAKLEHNNYDSVA